MGLFSQDNKCAVCGTKIGAEHWVFADKKQCCGGCAARLGALDTVTVSISSAAAKRLLGVFNADKSVGNYLKIDSGLKQWQINDGLLGTMGQIRSFDSVMCYELIADGTTVTKGGISIGRAIAGGVLFGTVGAVLGGISGKTVTKPVCTSLEIKIILNDAQNPVAYITFISKPTEADGAVYKLAECAAQECMALFDAMCFGKGEENKDGYK